MFKVYNFQVLPIQPPSRRLSGAPDRFGAPTGSQFLAYFCKEGATVIRSFGAIKAPHGDLLQHTSISRASQHFDTLSHVTPRFKGKPGRKSNVF